MILNNIASMLQLFAFPVVLIVLGVCAIALTISLTRFLRAQRRLANARRGAIVAPQQASEAAFSGSAAVAEASAPAAAE